MSVENLRDRSEVGNPNARKSQNAGGELPVESLGAQQLFTKTRLMLKIEEAHGKSIDSIFREKYWDQEERPKEIMKELGIGRVSFYKWIHATGVGVRTTAEAVRLVWKRWKETGETPVTISNRSQAKYEEARQMLEIGSDDEFKTYLQEMYREHRSLQAMTKEFKNNGINVGNTVVKNWMSRLGIQRMTESIGRLEEDDRSFVEKSYKSGAFWILTSKEKEALTLRFLEGRTFKESADIAGVKDRRVMWERTDSGLRRLRENATRC